MSRYLDTWLEPQHARRITNPTRKSSSTATSNLPAKRFSFHGGVQSAIQSTEPEILSAGPAGTGKTLAWLAKIYRISCQHPGARVLIVRKTRSSLTDSVLVTFERDILGPSHPLFTRSRVHRLNRSSYQFRNGSEIVLGGMDRPDKVLSSEYDLIYVPEATDLDVTDWETLSGRLRSAKVPHQQLVGDCNPTSPSHWLYQRCTAGLTKLIPTTHRDNPAYWDRERNEWTPRGLQYLDRLGRLTGARRARFLEGKWVQAEGLVFDGWDIGYHVRDSFPVPGHWPLYLSIDFGVNNPFVCQWWREDPDGRVWLTKEIYHTGRIIEDHAKTIAVELAKEPTKPRFVVCDHDLGDRLTLERHTGLSTVAADKKDIAGVQEVCERLKPGADGNPRLMVFRNSLCHEPDPSLVAAGKPTCTADEIPGYVWDTSVKRGERPLKRNDHGCLVAGTSVATRTGPHPIELIQPGMEVATRAGWRRVLDAGMTQASAVIYRVRFSDGNQIEGTGDHPVWIEERGWTPVESLAVGEVALSIGESTWRLSNWYRRNESCACGSTASSIDGIRTRGTYVTGRTFGRGMATWLNMAGRRFIGTCGDSTTGRFPTISRLTIGTASARTTQSGTCNCSRRPNTLRSTARNFANSAEIGCSRCRPMNWPAPSSECGDGTRLTPGVPGTVSTLETSPRRCRLWNWSASTVPGDTPSRPTLASSPSSAISIAGPPHVAPVASTTRTGPAHAEPSSGATSTCRLEPVPVHVVSVARLKGRRPVFNLTVDGAPEFFANGVLVHNCDALRYFARWLAINGGGSAPQTGTHETSVIGYDIRNTTF